MKCNALIKDEEKYFSLTGKQKNIGDSVSHTVAEVRHLVKVGAIELTPLQKEIFKEHKFGAQVEATEYFKKRVDSLVDFQKFAKELVKEIGILYDVNKIWWLWNNKENRYVKVDETDVMNAVDTKINFSSSTLQMSVKSQIVEGLKREARKQRVKELPVNMIQFRNKLVDVYTGEELNVSKEFFTTNTIPWDISDSEDTPVLDKLFCDWVGDDKKELLFEILAFCLARKYFIHRIFCFTGSGRNGKSCFLNVAETFLGVDNCTSTDLESLSQSRFESSDLYKKLFCSMGETNFSVFKKTSLIKRLTGQDSVRIEFKGISKFNDKNYAKILIATNSLPETLDKTEGFYRRWLIIDFPNNFEENGDIVASIPEIEYCCLARKSLKYLKRLLETNKFSFEPSIEERKKMYEERSNPIELFIKDNYEKDFTSFVPFYVFYERYIGYLQDKGMRIVSKIEAGKMIEALGYERHRQNYVKKSGEKSSYWVITGLKEKSVDLKLVNDVKQKSLFDDAIAGGNVDEL